MKLIESHPSRLPGELLHGSFFGVELEKYDIAERRCDNAIFKIGRNFWNRAWETSIFDEQQNSKTGQKRSSCSKSLNSYSRLDVLDMDYFLKTWCLKLAS